MHIAGSIRFIISKADKSKIQLTETDKISCCLVTILAKNTKVVAVHIKSFNNCCEIYIFKNNIWLEKIINLSTKSRYTWQVYLKCSMNFEEAFQGDL